MRTANDIVKAASLMGACAKSNGVSDWKSLVWLFFSPQGREFCEDNRFPALEMFREMKPYVADYGVFVDSGNLVRSNDTNIGLIGETSAELVYDDNTKVHMVILMHGAKAKIRVKGYAVVHLVNVGDCNVEIEKDETAVVL